jgi:hypothetical protein
MIFTKKEQLIQTNTFSNIKILHVVKSNTILKRNLKMIKRKNTPISTPDNGEEISIQVYKGEPKKLPKDKLENVILNLSKSLKDVKDKYEELDENVNMLTKQNEAMKIQMHQIIQENHHKKYDKLM